jgi:hypothetical protein
MASLIETIVQNWAPIGVMSFFVMSFIRQSKQVQKLIEELKEEKEASQETVFGVPGRKYHSLYYKIGQMENSVLDLQDQYYALAKKCNDFLMKDADGPVACPPISLDAVRAATPNKIKVCRGPYKTSRAEDDEESFCLLQKEDM